MTGDDQIDSLMETYNLDLDRYYHWPTAHAAVLYAQKATNIFVLGKKFKPIDGVIYAKPNGAVGDGDDIKVSIEQDYLMYEFSEGWGDCPAGSTHRHYWLFHVKFDGTVKFISSYGDPLP